MSEKDCIIITNNTWSPFSEINDPVKILAVEVLPFVKVQGEARSQDYSSNYYKLCGPLITLMKEYIIKIKSR